MTSERNTEDKQQKVTIDRAPREAETREAYEDLSDRWLPQDILPSPDPQPGWKFRYVRTKSYGNADSTNVSRQFREGWIPVKRDEVPEIDVPNDVDARFGEEHVEIGGQLLCKMPTEKLNKRDEYFRKMASAQMESVDNNLFAQQDPRMPIHAPKRQTRFSKFGKG